jgi:hypothetical protein
MFKLYFNTYASTKLLFNILLTNDNMDFLNELRNNMENSMFIIRKKLDPIILAILLAFPFNICKKADNMNYDQYYLSLYSPVLTNIYTIESLLPYKFVPVTFANKKYLQNYVLYMKLNIEYDTISCLHHVTPEIITVLANIYDRKHFNTMYVDMDYFETIKNKKGIEKFIVNYKKTLDTIKMDCLPYIEKSSLDYLKKISPEMSYYFQLIDFNNFDNINDISSDE